MDGRVEEARLLKHHTHLPADTQSFVVSHRPDIAAVPRHGSIVRSAEGRKQAQQRRLAGAGWTHDGDDFARFDR